MMKHFKVNPLFFLVTFLSWYTGSFASFLITYISLVFHEGIHLYFLAKHQIPVRKIVIEPFGISIETARRMPQNAIVYLSAPIGNLLVAGILILLQLWQKNLVYAQWIIANLCLGLVNLLPILPLDGGRVLLLKIEQKYGKEEAKKRMVFFSCALLVPLILVTVFLIGKTDGSFGLLLVLIFICYTLLSGNRLFTYKKLKNQAFRNENGAFQTVQEVEHLGVRWDYPARKLLKNFCGEKYYIINIFKDGTLLKTVTETQILNKILTTEKNITVLEC